MIIHSLLDTDLYKFTMMQAVLHQHPAAQVDYRFKCRTPGVDLAQFIEEISREIDALCRLRLREDEVAYLRSLRFIKPDFADFLALFHLDRKYLQLSASTTHPGEIELTIRGPWLHTILFEVPLLAIINEVWFRNTSEPDFEQGRSRLREKVSNLRSMPAGCKIADYGTRRRYSQQWHGELLPLLRDGLGEQFVGTSNVYFAKHYGLTPLGTMAHSICRPSRRWGRGCAIRRWRRWNRGRASTAAIWVSRCPMWSGWMRFCAISTCISASCSTACAMIQVTRSTGASGSSRTSRRTASTPRPKCWCSAMASISTR